MIDRHYRHRTGVTITDANPALGFSYFSMGAHCWVIVMSLPCFALRYCRTMSDVRMLVTEPVFIET